MQRYIRKLPVVALRNCVLILSATGLFAQCPPSPSPTDLVLPNSPCPSSSYSSGTWNFQATNSITANSILVYGSANVILNAGNWVQLNPGFHAVAGTGQTLHIFVSQPLTITTSSLQSGTVGTPYSQTLSASGGRPGYSWSIISGSLPGGLTLSGNTITGTPSAAGTATLTLQVTDSAFATQSATFNLSIAGGGTPVTEYIYLNGRAVALEVGMR